ncbi:MAG: hypothetical protein Q8934_15495 [Bacillota bacterium]|nr:hypothetical protein [Bacillota bacterium]
MKITLSKEQTIKFLMCFVEDAKRIANERKKEAQQHRSSLIIPIDKELELTK